MWPHRRQPIKLPHPWDSSGKNTGISCNFFFQGTFPTQGSNLNLLHWQVDSLPLSIGEAPRSLFVIYNILHTIVCVCQSQSPSLSLPTPYPAGNHPLQCSCLENPRDGGAWWAAVYGVAQSRTRLKRLSSSSSMYKISNKDPLCSTGNNTQYFIITCIW